LFQDKDDFPGPERLVTKRAVRIHDAPAEMKAVYDANAGTVRW
jgi:hypothetical protein